jgi:hypothetical protein
VRSIRREAKSDSRNGIYGISLTGRTGVRIRIDGVYMGPDGRILFGEAKVGNYADFTPNQKLEYPNCKMVTVSFMAAIHMRSLSDWGFNRIRTAVHA